MEVIWGSERNARRTWRLGGARLAGAGVFRSLRCAWAMKFSAESKMGLGRSSPRAQIEGRAGAEGSSARSGRWRWAALAVRARWWSSGFGSPRVTAPWYCRGGRRSGGQEMGRRRGISVRSNSPAVHFGSKSGEGVVWTGASELRKAPWVHGRAHARICRGGEAAGWRERGGVEPLRGGAKGGGG